MMAERRLGWGIQAFSAAGFQEDADPSSDYGATSREVDERTAIYLLSLARELLRRDHSAIAGMIDYAIAEIETETDGED